MASVVSAAVISGELIIGLDDGSVIRAGYVQGPQGLKGDPGPMGATGARGTDGNTIHTVGGTPRNDMGTDGDYAIDNINWRIYGPKSGGVWGKAKEMLPGPENVLENGRMTAMTGGGGGGAGPSEATDIIVGPNTPNLGDSINGLKQGQLWFDTEQLALYILVLNSNQERVWVITIPADRSALQDQIVGFTLPGNSGANRIDNGATVYNPTTGLWYYYNKPKNQWIDLPPGENLLQLRNFLVWNDFEVDDDTFQYEQADRDNFGTNALTYINRQDHPTTQRIVVSKTDLDDFNWSLLLSSIIEGDQLTLLQVEPGDIGLGTDDRSLRTDYLVVSAPTENSESFSFEVDYQQQNEAHNPRFGGFVSIEFQAVVNQTSGTYYQDNAPIDDGSLKPGNLWIESDTLLGHVWTGSEWAQLGDASSTGFNVTTRDVKTVARDVPFGSDEMRNVVPADPIDDLLKTQEDVNDFIADVSTRSIRAFTRTGDNLDFIQDTGGEGYFTHVAKPAGPVPLDPGTLVLLQDGGAEATNYSEVQNVIMSKTGIGDYANFNNAKVGDYLILQSAESRGAGQFVIDSITDFGGSWDMAVRVVSGRAFGSFPQIDQRIQVRTTRPIFLLPSPTQPVVSSEGYIWFKSDDHELYVSTRGDSDPEEQDVPQWVKIGPGADETGADIHVGNFPPANPSEGLLWYETYTDTLFIYVNGVWKPAANITYKTELNELGNFKYLRANDQDVFGTGKLLNITNTGSQPHDSLTDLKIHKTSNNSITTPNDSWEPGQFISITKGADKVLYKVLEATPSDNGNFVEIEVEFIELQGQSFSFFYEDTVGLGRREKLTPEELTGDYLPLTGGTLTGDLTVEAPLIVEGSEFKVQYADDTTMLRVQPNAQNIVLKASTINTRDTPGSLSGRAGVEIQVHGDKPLAISHSGSYQPTLEIYGYNGEAPGGRARNLFITAGGNINLEGNVNAQSFVKGSELRSTKLTSGQSSNLQIYRGSGADEERKMLIGTDSVNFDVSIKLVDSSKKDIIVQNGTKLYVSDEGGEIITFGGSGAFYRGNITTDDHLVNKGYIDGVAEDLEQKIEEASKGRVRLGEFVLRTTSGQPTGNSLAGELTLWHLAAGATTTPVNEFKLRPTDDAEYSSKDIYNLLAELFEGKPYVVVLKQNDKEIHYVGNDTGWLTDSERTFHLSCVEYDGDTLTEGDVVELFAEVSIDSALDDFYLKSGGDIHGFVRIVKPDGVLLGTRPNDAADNLFQVWADGTVDLRHELKFNGSSKKIKAGSTELFDFAGNNVRIPRRGDNTIGFQLKGKSDADDNLFNVYHRPDKDEIMYRGMINDPKAIVTKEWVEQNAGGFTPGERVAKDNSSGVAVGGFYIQNGNIFAKIS